MLDDDDLRRALQTTDDGIIMRWVAASEWKWNARVIWAIAMVAALVFAITIAIVSGPVHDCHWDYRHVYADRGTDGDVGEARYCAGYP